MYCTAADVRFWLCWGNCGVQWGRITYKHKVSLILIIQPLIVNRGAWYPGGSLRAIAWCWLLSLFYSVTSLGVVISTRYGQQFRDGAIFLQPGCVKNSVCRSGAYIAHLGRWPDSMLHIIEVCFSHDLDWIAYTQWTTMVVTWWIFLGFSNEWPSKSSCCTQSASFQPPHPTHRCPPIISLMSKSVLVKIKPVLATSIINMIGNSD